MMSKTGRLLGDMAKLRAQLDESERERAALRAVAKEKAEQIDLLQTEVNSLRNELTRSKAASLKHAMSYSDLKTMTMRLMNTALEEYRYHEENWTNTVADTERS